MDVEVDVEHVLKYGDPRLKNLPLTQSPVKTIIVVCIYCIFIKFVGPWWMRNRKPFVLRNYMLIYNATMVFISSWMFYHFARYAWFNKYSWRCESIDYSNDDVSLKILYACYVFYLSKFLELFDTIFFVLRKKYSQITFLHFFHHSIVPVTTWYGLNYGGGGYATILPLCNTFVHVWMYSYYALSALGPSVQKYLWWKKYLTLLQLVQFMIVMVSIGQVIIFPDKNCNATLFTLWLVMGQAIVFFVLFIHFYIASYKKKPVDASVADRRNGHANGHLSSSSVKKKD